jgi:uncharacterized protein
MFKWRPLVCRLHRDAGFLILGLTLVYAISGVAVNHKRHWDPSYATRVERLEPGPPEALIRPADGAGLGQGVAERGEHARDTIAAGVDRGQLAREQQERLVHALCAALGRSDEPRTVMWRGADRLSLLFGEGDRDVVDYEPSTGKAEHTVKTGRLLIRWLNLLHYNARPKVWTWVGDCFAVLLAFMAVSGVVMVRGKRGLWGRGGLLALVGLALPLLLLLVLG